jgi:hypothetical protein
MRWALAGTSIGAVFAVLALTDARRYLPAAIRPTDVADFYLCQWMILGFMPWHHSLFLFNCWVIFLNAITYGLLLWLMGILLHRLSIHYATFRRGHP